MSEQASTALLHFMFIFCFNYILKQVQVTDQAFCVCNGLNASQLCVCLWHTA